MVAGQKVALGRLHRHRTVTVTVSDTTVAIDLGDVKVVRRTTTQPVRSTKGQRHDQVLPTDCVTHRHPREIHRSAHREHPLSNETVKGRDCADERDH